MIIKKKMILITLFMTILMLTSFGFINYSSADTSDWIDDFTKANAEIDENDMRTGLNLYTNSQESKWIESDPNNHMTVVQGKDPTGKDYTNGVFKTANKYWISTTYPYESDPPSSRIKPNSDHWLQMTVNNPDSPNSNITYGPDGQPRSTNLTRAAETCLTLRYKNVRKICI